MSNGPPPARPDGTVNDARWLFPQERAPPPRIPQTTISPSSSFGFSHSEWLGFSLSEDHSAAIRYFDWRIPLVRIAVAEFKKRFESAIYRLGLEKLPLTLLYGHATDALRAADVALVASGTATLEAGMDLRSARRAMPSTRTSPWWPPLQKP